MELKMELKIFNREAKAIQLGLVEENGHIFLAVVDDYGDIIGAGRIAKITKEGLEIQRSFEDGHGFFKMDGSHINVTKE